MRILHTSDWHLGATLNNAPLLAEQQNFLKKLYDIAQSEKVDAIIVAGDIFDRAVSNADAIALYNEAMTELCIQQKIPVLICAGNHDGAARLSSCGKLLERAGLYIAGSVRDGLSQVDVGDTTFHLLPFFSIDEIRYLYPDEKITSYDAAMRTIVNHISLDRSKNNVLIAHCFVTGAQPSESDRSAVVGGANMVSVDTFEGFDYVALGHLHKAQNIGKNVRYSGSPVKLSFSEAKMHKSVTIIDTTDFSRSEIALQMERELRVLRGEYSALIDAAEYDDRREDYIKIEILDEYAHMEILNTFRNFYPNLLSLTGKQFLNVETALSVDEAGSLDPMDIMVRFYQDYTGAQPNEKQTEWFKKALEVQQRRGDVQ